MKTAPNREQFLFLVAGGIILGLILVVVVFNMLGNSSSNMAENEAHVRPVVTLPPQKGAPTDGGPAAVFSNQGLPPLPEEVPARVSPEHATRTDVPNVIAPAAAVTTPRTDGKGEKKPEPAKPVAKAEPAKPPAKPEPPVVAKTPAKPEAVAKAEPAKPTAKAGAPEGKFAVNMGAFKEESRAAALKNKLAGMGLPVYLQQTSDKNGAVFHRVRLGPYASRAEADAASRSAKEKSGSAGTVIAFGQ